MIDHSILAAFLRSVVSRDTEVVDPLLLIVFSSLKNQRTLTINVPNTDTYQLHDRLLSTRNLQSAKIFRKPFDMRCVVCI